LSIRKEALSGTQEIFHAAPVFAGAAFFLESP